MIKNTWASIIFVMCFLCFGIRVDAQKKKPVKPKTPVKNTPNSTESKITESDEVLVQIYGSDVYEIYPDVVNSNVMYATTPTGLYKTEDKGLYWKLMANPFKPNDKPNRQILFAQSSANPNIFYLAVGKYDVSSVGYVWQSEDAGKTWTNVSAGIIGVGGGEWKPESLIISPKDSAIVYALFSGRIYKTFNSGKSWGKLPLPTPALGYEDRISLRINPNRPDYLISYISQTSSGLSGNWESIDGGMTWSEKKFDINYNDVSSKRPRKTNSVSKIYFHSQNTNLIYATLGQTTLLVSEDGGTTWRDISFNDPDKEKVQTLAIKKRAEVKNVSFSKESEDVLYVAADKGSFISENRGKSWEKINWNGATTVISPEPNTIFIVTEFSTQKSKDSGKTWISAGFGLPKQLERDFWYSTIPCFIDDVKDLIYLCQGSGLLISQNNGFNWRWRETVFERGTKIQRMTALSDGTFYLNGITTNNFKNTLIKVTSDGKSSVIYQKTDFGIIGAISVSDPKVIYARDSISTDEGFSWRQMNLGFNLAEFYEYGYPNSNRVTNIVSPVSSSISYLYAHLRKSIHVTTNQGDSWKTMVTPEETGENSTILPDPQDAMTVYWGNKNAVYCSKNAGANWERLTAKTIDFGEIKKFNINPKDSNQIFITSSRGLWKTLNNGKTWQLVNQGLDGDLLNEILISNKIVIAIGERGVYRLSDKTLSWAKN